MLAPNSTADLDLAWQADNAPVNINWGLNSTSGTASGDGIADTALVATTTEVVSYILVGYIKTHATLASVLDMQWAQNVSSGTSVMHEGSWITFTKMS